MKEKIGSWLKLDQLIENLTGYVDAKVKLTKLQIQEEVSLGISKLVIAFLQFMLFCWILFFIYFTLALWIGEYLESYALGFALLTAISLVKALLFFWQRKKIIQLIMRKVGKNIVQSIDNEHENNATESARPEEGGAQATGESV